MVSPLTRVQQRIGGRGSRPSGEPGSDYQAHNHRSAFHAYCNGQEHFFSGTSCGCSLSSSLLVFLQTLFETVWIGATENTPQQRFGARSNRSFAQPPFAR
jgi:hypothetical protein